jgi:hypothetical protein
MSESRVTAVDSVDIAGDWRLARPYPPLRSRWHPFVSAYATRDHCLEVDPMRETNAITKCRNVGPTRARDPPACNRLSTPGQPLLPSLQESLLQE